MKFLNRTAASKDTTPHLKLEDTQPASSSTRTLRAGILSRFRRSSPEAASNKKRSGVCVSWKNKYDHLSFRSKPRPALQQQSDEFGEDVVLKGTTAEAGDVSARTNMLRASSIATAEMTIPTDGSMAATSSTESSFCQEGDASFLRAAEATVETREVLIQTVDGQIETQRQEFILMDMYQVNVDCTDKLFGGEEASSAAPDAFRSMTEDDDAFTLGEWSDSSSVFSENESAVGGGVVKDAKRSVGEKEDDDSSVTFVEEKEEEDDEEIDGDNDEEDLFSDDEEESFQGAEKGVALLQSLFLSDFPDDEEDYSAYSNDSDTELGSTHTNENTFAAALDMFEEFAAESIYSASVLLLGPTESEQKRRRRKRRENEARSAVEDSGSVTSQNGNIPHNPSSLAPQQSVLSS